MQQQSQAANAYQRTAKIAASPRDIEANLLSKSAANLQRIRDDWDVKRSELDNALTYNRKLWTVLLTTVTREENPLPIPVKQNIANLGLFVMNQTITIFSDPLPHKLDVLININRELSQGLRAQAAQQPAS